MSNKALIRDLKEGKLNLSMEAAAVIDDQDAEVAQMKKTNMSLCRDLDEAQQAYEHAIGIHL